MGLRFMASDGPKPYHHAIPVHHCIRDAPRRPFDQESPMGLIVKKDGHILTLTLSRPEVRNAWDNDFHEKLGFTKTFELRLYSAAGKPLGSASGEPTPSAVSAFNDVLAKGCKTSTTG